VNRPVLNESEWKRLVVCDDVAGSEDFRTQGSNALRRVGHRIHQNQFSVSAVIPDQSNAVASEQVPDALLSLGVLPPINECQGDSYQPAEHSSPRHIVC